jgi:iron complex outermembrane recepter protein
MTRNVMFASAAMAVVLAAPQAGWAQAAPQGQGAEEIGLSEIIVTARKRQENLQEVPLSVSAFTADTIEQAGLKSVADIAQQTPGFSFRAGFGRTFDRPVIRGMSNIQGAANAAFFYDGVFISGPVTGYQLDNLERVEVIKGPQAALYGRNTFAGAVNFIPREPGNELTGKISATVGQSKNYEASGYVSGPIIADLLLAEVNARVYRFGGQYVNPADSFENLGREKSDSIGGALVFKPFEPFKLTIRGLFAHDRDGAFPFAPIGRQFGTPTTFPTGVLFTGGINCFQPALTGAISNGRPVSATRARGYWCGEVPTPAQAASNTAQYRAGGYADAINRKLFRVSTRAEYDLNDWTLQATGAWNKRIQHGFTDQDYSEGRAPGFETYQRDGEEDYSVEGKVQSPAEFWLRGQAGVYYFKVRDNPQNYSGDLRRQTSLGAPTAGAFQVGDSPSWLPKNSVFRNTAENISFFAQLEAELFERLKVSVEGRYQEDTLSFSGTSTTTVGTTVFTRSLGPGQTVNPNVKYKKFLPRATADFKLTDGALIYGVVAKGNKPGGFNTGVYGAIYDDATVANLVSLGFATFKEEEAWAYELGAKTEWFDRRLKINVAGYYTDWSNQQLTQTASAIRRDGVLAAVSFTTNVGKSEVKGLEIDITGRPTDWLELRLGYALQDTKIREFVSDDQADFFLTAADFAQLNITAPPAPAGSSTAVVNAALQARIAAANALIASKGNSKGNKLPRVPQHQILAGASVFYDFTDEIRGILRIDSTYESKRYIQVDNFGYAGDSFLVNLRGTVEYKNVSLSVAVNNLLNDKTPLDTLRSIDPFQSFVVPNTRSFGTGSASLRDFIVSMPRLRHVSASVSYKF